MAEEVTWHEAMAAQGKANPDAFEPSMINLNQADRDSASEDDEALAQAGIDVNEEAEDSESSSSDDDLSSSDSSSDDE